MGPRAGVDSLRLCAWHFRLAGIVLFTACIPVLCSSAQAPDEPVESASISYVYSGVLGAGYYVAPGGRVLVGSLPMSWPLPQLNERNRIRLLFPVTGGIGEIRDEEGDLDLPDQLLTFSFMPGLAWEHFALDNWILVPSAQVGFTKDFEADTTVGVYSTGLRSNAWWQSGGQQIVFGTRLLGAGQFGGDSTGQAGFVMLENGVDWDHRLPWSVIGHRLSGSLYFVWSHIEDDMRLDAFSGENVRLENLYQLGLSIGFRESVTILRLIPIHRVGISVGRGNTLAGDQLRSVNFNLGFPLAYD